MLRVVTQVALPQVLRAQQWARSMHGFNLRCERPSHKSYTFLEHFLGHDPAAEKRYQTHIAQQIHNSAPQQDPSLAHSMTHTGLAAPTAACLSVFENEIMKQIPEGFRNISIPALNTVGRDLCLSAHLASQLYGPNPPIPKLSHISLTYFAGEGSFYPMGEALKRYMKHQGYRFVGEHFSHAVRRTLAFMPENQAFTVAPDDLLRQQLCGVVACIVDTDRLDVSYVAREAYRRLAHFHNDPKTVRSTEEAGMTPVIRAAVRHHGLTSGLYLQVLSPEGGSTVDKLSHRLSVLGHRMTEAATRHNILYGHDLGGVRSSHCIVKGYNGLLFMHGLSQLLPVGQSAIDVMRNAPNEPAQAVGQVDYSPSAAICISTNHQIFCPMSIVFT